MLEFGNPIIITFTINEISYQAEEGMTWNQWVNSKYKTDYWENDGSAIIDNNNMMVITGISVNDTIIANYTYQTEFD